MSVTGPFAAPKDAYAQEIERLAASSLLQGSESLCKLLRYLAEEAIDHPGAPVKEYQIATEVFGRPASFDPRLDSTVRVQTGRLRSKLAEYYSGAGAEDSIVVEIPKGSYALTFHKKASPALPAPYVPAQAPSEANGGPAPPSFNPQQALYPQTPVAERKPRALQASLLALSIALAAAIGLIGFLLVNKPGSAPITESDADPAALRAFWKGFLVQNQEPLVVFSNAEFIGRPETGMRYFNPATDSKESILDHYTGVGEVLAVHDLDVLFASLRHGLRVKRGRLLSLDDVSNNNVLFVGSPSENLTLRELPISQDFVFRRTEARSKKGELAIIDLHPKPSEQPMYFASATVPVAEDYAIVALAPGPNSAHQVMLLAGTTTLGTQAAVEFVCRSKTVEDLLVRVSGSKTASPGPFEAVLKIKVSRGVPVASEIVALHTR